MQAGQIAFVDAGAMAQAISATGRVALYGIDQLIAAKKVDKLGLDTQPFTETIAREREELQAAEASDLHVLADLGDLGDGAAQLAGGGVFGSGGSLNVRTGDAKDAGGKKS